MTLHQVSLKALFRAPLHLLSYHNHPQKHKRKAVLLSFREFCKALLANPVYKKQTTKTKNKTKAEQNKKQNTDISCCVHACGGHIDFAPRASLKIIAIGINKFFYCDNSSTITIKEKIILISIMGCFGSKINMVDHICEMVYCMCGSRKYPCSPHGRSSEIPSCSKRC